MPAISAEERQVIINNAISGISHIATLPEITLKIIELVEDPSSTAQDLHDVIANDPALCSRVLKVVNSAFYGLPRQIGSINRAIVLLGLNAVKNIAIAASLAKLFKGGELCEGFSARDLWSHSTACAAAAKLICDEVKLGVPDEAFLAGLIHDIGMMVELQAHPNKLVEVVEKLSFDTGGWPEQDMRDLEQEVLGANHEQFGAALCESWKFPKSFTCVAGHHHEPLALPSGNQALPCVVHVADILTAEMEDGFRADITNREISDGVLEVIRVTRPQLEAIRGALPKAIEDVEALFGAAA